MHYSYFKDLMTSPKLDLVKNVYGFISTSVIPIKTKLDRMLDKDASFLPCRFDNIITNRSRDRHPCVHIHLHKGFNNQASQDNRPECTNLTIRYHDVTKTRSRG